MLTRHFPMRFVAIVVFFATLWLILWRQLSGEWSVNDQYSYGWFVPFFAVVLFTLVAVPWVSLVEEPIVQGLMRVVAAVASEVVALFGIPAQLEGNLIRTPGGLVGVNEACSGVRSLQTSLMIGLLFGELKRLSIFRRIVLVAVAGAIA